MRNKLFSAILLSTLLLISNQSVKSEDEWPAQGTLNLNSDYSVDSDKQFPEQTGDITINANENNVNGNSHRGYGASDHDLDYDHNLTIENAGKFTLDESGSGESIIILDDDGNRTNKNLNVTKDGFNNFSYDGSGPNSVNSSIFSAEDNKTIIKKSVFKNNRVTENASDDNGRQGGAFQWTAFPVEYDDEWNIQDRDQHLDEKFEMSDSVVIENYINTSKAGEENEGTTVMGGALYFSGNNEDVGNTANIINSYIIGNYIKAPKCVMAEGGAVAYDGIYSSLVKGTYFGKNYVDAKDAYGGALYYSTAWVYGYTYDTNTIENSVFQGNYVKGSQGAYGGAVASYDFFNIKNSLFLDNYAEGNNFAKGGAIYAQSDPNNEYEQIVFEITNSDFENNYVKLKGSSVPDDNYFEWQRDEASGGGAIYNESGSMLIVKDSTFKNNKVIGDGASGGAIFNAKDATLAVIAENSDVLFEGNTAGSTDGNQVSNGIADNGGTIYLNAKDGRTIHLNDKITSYNANPDGNIYINKYYDPEADWESRFEDDEDDDEYSLSSEKSARAAENYGGRVLLNADMTEYKGTVNLEGGILAVGKDMPSDDAEGVKTVNLFTGAKEFNVNNNSTLDISSDERIATYNLGNLNLKADLNTVINADLAESKMDNLDAKSVTGEGNIIVDSFVLLSDSPDTNPVDIQLAGESLKDKLQLSEKAKEALSEIYRYGVSYDEDEGEFTFQRAGLISDGKGGTTTTWQSFNPTVLASQVAVQAGAVATMNHAFYYAMQNSDNYMNYPKAKRFALKSANRYAATSLSGSPFSPLYTKQAMNGFWFKPYATFENVPLKNGPKVQNITYGALAGYDSEITTTKTGWERTFTGYIGYNGATQKFTGVDSYLNGGLLGATMSLYKGNFFNAATLSAGSIIGDSSNMFGKEDFALFMSGIADKFGYNIEINDGKVILQPSMLMGYTFVNTFDYTNSAGVRIESDPANVLQLSPGMKLIFNSESGWQPYISVSMIWNLINNSKVTADNVLLPEMTIKPYIEYGLGVQRQVEDNLMLFGQAMAQNGGRNGVALTGGIRWAVGRD